MQLSLNQKERLKLNLMQQILQFQKAQAGAKIRQSTMLQEELENYFSFQLTKILKQPTEQKELKKHEIVFSKNLLRAGKL